MRFFCCQIEKQSKAKQNDIQILSLILEIQRQQIPYYISTIYIMIRTNPYYLRLLSENRLLAGEDSGDEG